MTAVVMNHFFPPRRINWGGFWGNYKSFRPVQTRSRPHASLWPGVQSLLSLEPRVGAQSGTETGAGRSHRGRYRLHQPMAHWGRFVWDRKKRKRLTCPPALPPEGLLGFTVWGEVTDKAVRRTDSCGQPLEHLVDNLSGQRRHVTGVLVCCPFRVQLPPLIVGLTLEVDRCKECTFKNTSLY